MALRSFICLCLLLSVSVALWLWLWLWLRRKKNCVGDWSASGLVAQELYDHTGDKGYGPQTFDDFEFTNLAYDAAHQVQKVFKVTTINKYNTTWIEFEGEASGTGGASIIITAPQ